MKMRVFQDSVRVCILLGCFLAGFAVLPAFSDELCDNGINQRLLDAMNTNATKTQDLLHNAFTGPASRDQIANSPCVSQELNKVTSQFSNAGSGLLGGLTGGLGGNVGDILNNFFKSGFESLNKTAELVPQMLNFQSQASGILGGLLSNLGGAGGGFNSDLCGMMIDMLVKYIQCKVPVQMPSLGDLTGSLNINLPDSCEGNAARDAMYQLSNSRQFEDVGQPVLQNATGLLTGGSASFRSGQ